MPCLGLWKAALRSAIGFTAVLHTVDGHGLLLVVYLIKNAVRAYTQAVVYSPSKSLYIWRTGIVSQAINVLAH